MQEREAAAIDPHEKPLGKKERLYLRHRWHSRILFISRLATATAFLIVILMAATLTGTDLVERALSVADYEEFAAEIMLALLSPLLLVVFRAFTSAQHYATGAAATDQQFEHVHLMVEHYSKLAGLKRTPMIAIVSGASFLAKSTSNFGKAAILVHSDLLDAPRPDSDDWGALRFAIAREVGNIAAGHRDLSYELSTVVTQSVRYLSNPLRRAEAYTADRYGAVLAPDAVSDYFAVVAVSKDCWQEMSIRAAVARAGRVGIGQMIVGLLGEVPPIVWRLQALAWLGVLNCDVLPCRAQSPEGYSDFLKKLPAKPVRIVDLKQRHGAFFLPPEIMTEKTLDELCPKGTNQERLSRAFADYREQ